MYGTEAGGDADELRLLSTNETFINLRAHGGSLDFVSTKVGAFYAAATPNRPKKGKPVAHFGENVMLRVGQFRHPECLLFCWLCPADET